MSKIRNSSMQENLLSSVPDIHVRRSKFDRSSGHKTTFDNGSLIPIYADEVLPGDTHSIDISSVVRLLTPIAPTMDNQYLDIYFFYVPNRIVYDHWQELMGENKQGSWTNNKTPRTVPKLVAPTGGFAEGSIADYFGIPTKVAGFAINHLPFRGYALIWNEYFRDQNVQDPTFIDTTEVMTQGINKSSGNYNNYVVGPIAGGKPLRVNKFHDYFTSCLPQPQKGSAVPIGITQDTPVYTTVGTGGGFSVRSGLSDTKVRYLEPNTSIGAVVASIEATNTPNLWAKTSQLSSITVNELRQSFQIQKMLERDARGGTRYTEMLRSHFGVVAPDARLQRPEYLGGQRVHINISQVIQTSSTDSTSPQGHETAYSLSGSVDTAFTKSFTEHGWIIGVACARHVHTYQQGLERQWSRFDRLDFYHPVFANIGETAVLNKEIYVSGNETTDNQVFGYQGAWSDYRFKQNRVSGMMRSNTADGSLDVWHYADKYNSTPALSANWMFEDKDLVARTLAVQTGDQFKADFHFKVISVRPMPIHSVPGLIDHN